MAVYEHRVSEPSGALGVEVLVSRQPVVDSQMRVRGYRVSYASVEASRLAACGERWVTRLFDDVLSAVGLDDLVSSGVAHLMVSSELLLTVGAPPVHPDRVILRVAHETASDRELAQILDALVGGGYALALTDLPDPRFDRGLLDVFRTLEVDFSLWDELDAAAAVARIGPAPVTPLAAGLLNHSDYEIAMALGFELFTGPFFAAPRVTSARQVPVGDLAALSTLAELRGDADIEELEQLIEQDLGLSVKLLRYLNSAYFGLVSEITSIRQAVMMLGSLEISRWVLMIALIGGPATPPELAVMALTRARMCQLLGRRDGTSPHELFTVGLLSLADTLLDLPLGTIVSELRVGADLAQALLWHAGPAGGILDATIAFERGDFTAQSLQPNPGPAAIAYREALRWANATLASVIQA